MLSGTLLSLSHRATVDFTPDDANPSTYSVDVAPSHGTLTQNADFSWTYNPDDDYVGLDSFSLVGMDSASGLPTEPYEVHAETTNDPPTGYADGYLVVVGRPITVNVVRNDGDPDGDTMTIEIVDDLHAYDEFQDPDAPPPPSPGTLSDNGDGTVTFTPAADFTGTAVFTYRPKDSLGAIDLTADPTTVGFSVFDPVGISHGPLASLETIGDDEGLVFTSFILSELPTDDPAVVQAELQRAAARQNANQAWSATETAAWEDYQEALDQEPALLNAANQQAGQARSNDSYTAAMAYTTAYFAALNSHLDAEEAAGEQFLTTISGIIGLTGGDGGGGGSTPFADVPTEAPTADASWDAAYGNFNSAITNAEAAHAAASAANRDALSMAEEGARTAFVDVVEAAALAFTGAYADAYGAYYSSLRTGATAFRDEFFGARSEYRSRMVDLTNAFQQSVCDAISGYLDELEGAQAAFDSTVAAVIDPARTTVLDAYADYYQAEAEYIDQVVTQVDLQEAKKSVFVAIAQAQADVASAAAQAFVTFVSSEQQAMSTMVTDLEQAHVDRYRAAGEAAIQRESRLINAEDAWTTAYYTAETTKQNALLAAEIDYDRALESAQNGLATTIFTAAASYDSAQLQADTAQEVANVQALGSLLGAIFAGGTTAGWSGEFTGALGSIINAAAALEGALDQAGAALSMSMEAAASQLSTQLMGIEQSYAQSINNNQLASTLRTAAAGYSYRRTANDADRTAVQDETSADVDWATALAAAVTQANTTAAQELADGLTTAAQGALQAAQNLPASDESFSLVPWQALLSRYTVGTTNVTEALEPRTQPTFITEWPGADEDAVLFAEYGIEHIPPEEGTAGAAAAASSGGGHHWVPEAVRNELEKLGGLTIDASAIFKTGTTGPLPYDHGFDTWSNVTHGQYSAAVQNMLQTYQQRLRRPLEDQDAAKFLGWISGGSEMPSNYFNAADVARVTQWRDGFYNSWTMANQVLAQAGSRNITLAKSEVKDIVRNVLNGERRKLSQKAGTVYNAVADDIAVMGADAYLKKFRAVKVFVIAGVLVGTYEAIGDANRGFAGEGFWGGSGVTGAMTEMADGAARRVAMKQEVEGVISTIYQGVAPVLAPPPISVHERAGRHGVTVNPYGEP